jgi:hypothetical protein
VRTAGRGRPGSGSGSRLCGFDGPQSSQLMRVMVVVMNSIEMLLWVVCDDKISHRKMLRFLTHHIRSCSSTHSNSQISLLLVAGHH